MFLCTHDKHSPSSTRSGSDSQVQSSPHPLCTTWYIGRCHSECSDGEPSQWSGLLAVPQYWETLPTTWGLLPPHFHWLCHQRPKCIGCTSLLYRHHTVTTMFSSHHPLSPSIPFTLPLSFPPFSSNTGMSQHSRLQGPTVTSKLQGNSGWHGNEARSGLGVNPCS